MTEHNWHNRNHTVDIIKGIAIIMVLITHYQWTADQRKLFVFPMVINMAVPIFLVITGYVYSISLEKQGVEHLEEAYTQRTILKRTFRYTFPVMAVIVWELCDPHFSIDPDLLEKLRWAIDGTAGKGNYYYPVMMQLVFVFPLIYFLIEKKREKGLLLAFSANAVYELLVWAYKIPTESYRLLMFRYIFLVAVGVYAFKGHKLSVCMSILLTAAGASFIVAVSYFGYEPMIVNKNWSATNFISAMLIVPLMIVVLQNVRICFLPLEIIGRSSYHIFLTQMVYYAGYYSELRGIVPKWQVHMILGVAICMVIGVVFYYIDKPIQDRIGILISGYDGEQEDKNCTRQIGE